MSEIKRPDVEAILERAEKAQVPNSRWPYIPEPEDVPALCRWVLELERWLKDAEDTINAMNEGPRE